MSYTVVMRRRRLHDSRCRYVRGRPPTWDGREPYGGLAAVAAFLRLVPCSICRPLEKK